MPHVFPLASQHTCCRESSLTGLLHLPQFPEPQISRIRADQMKKLAERVHPNLRQSAKSAVS
jgi:hypothetical protein